MLKPFLILIFSMLALVAMAGPKDAADFQEMAYKITNPLIAKGLRKVGGIDLTELPSKFKDIQVNAWPDNPALGSFGGSGSAWRETSIYLTEEKTILVMLGEWKQTPPDVRNVIALHELLGATGYNDDEYQASLNLWWLSFKPEDHFVSQALNAIQIRTDNVKFGVQITGGGATAIGGGGDSAVVEFKMNLLIYIDKFLPAERDELFNRVLNINIETDVLKPIQSEFEITNGKVIINKRLFKEGDTKTKINMSIRFLSALTGKVLNEIP